MLGPTTTPSAKPADNATISAAESLGPKPNTDAKAWHPRVSARLWRPWAEVAGWVMCMATIVSRFGLRALHGR